MLEWLVEVIFRIVMEVFIERFWRYFLAVASGALGVLAFSPFDYWWCAYLSLFGLIIVINSGQKKAALICAFLWGLSFFTLGLNWLHVSIHEFGGAPLVLSYGLVVLLAAYLSLYPLLFAYLIRKLKVRSAIIYPILWTFTEFLRGWLFTGFPWLQFGYTQIDSPFSGIAPMFGVTGLTFFVMLISAVVFQIFFVWFKAQPKALAQTLANGVILIVVSGLAFYSGKVDYVKSIKERELSVTLVQGNIAQNLKWDPAYLMQTIEIYQNLIAQNLGKSDLIILPEAALPALENQLQPFFLGLQNAAQRSGTQVMVGSIFLDEKLNKLFNSIVVAGDEQRPYSLAADNRYNKHHLVPFGEYVPLESLLRPLGTVFNLPMSAFQSGELVQTPLIAKSHSFLPAICYEIIFGDQLQQNLRANKPAQQRIDNEQSAPTDPLNDIDFLLTLSNDAWFGTSIGPWQHLQMARMRALELGKPLIRATNTGITVFVDAKGKIIAQAPQFEQTTLTHNIAPTSGKTPYAVLGDKPLYWLSAVLFALHFFSQWLRKKLVKLMQSQAGA